ncbi:hypothetical protein KL918_002906 [Ogataea parapolymorpha]|uniref:Manganese transporter SMF2 n=1 Tax=Ogataea parapolymorpha (strain ATCC 26012 / BCRC 20466 / JCM 22074 / NRRL Y-7560 / DL-1) TaxID=871575 RepID=W1QI43_OGAPD|nr:Manganese transporter SMF2 [Ogataea parapolymorpha DL-1]ESX01265.1 Manganese transporter SMF2 [Ogataea parapolymorpha DL-1]KAG7867467.1 hypothetical protein KL918_002906 [Ogataea parapolymorpha]KAG7871853.1 hypothetical protein KL916_003703 [Ogataea parapolymorpha]
MVDWRKLISFIGPGLLITCAYIDPGNYSTSTNAGAQFGYIHLFIIFLSNIFAIILQCLCIKLGTVTGLDLAQNCRKHLPRWLNITVYVLAELAIIFTDLAEIVGTAIALYILFGIELKVGVLLTIFDVLVILLAYNPDGSLKEIRKFEFFVSFLVLAAFACFIILMNKVEIPSKRELLEGFLPSKQLFTSKESIYLALGIIGATVMPHSLYLGSNLVKPRLREFDTSNQKDAAPLQVQSVVQDANEDTYKPSLAAIDYCLNYSYAELVCSLCIVAVFINSAILIVSAAALFKKPEAMDADLISIYELLSHYVSKTAGLIFAIAMLFSSIAAGIICTMSGALVAEGCLEWKLNPFYRRIVTRSIAIVPCMAMALFMGREGIATILNLSQVILSLILPFVSAPLLYFTCNKNIMKVKVQVQQPQDLENDTPTETSLLMPARKGDSFKDFSNSAITNVLALLTWGTIGFLNIYLIVQYFRGEDIHF